MTELFQEYHTHNVRHLQSRISREYAESYQNGQFNPTINNINNLIWLLANLTTFARYVNKSIRDYIDPRTLRNIKQIIREDYVLYKIPYENRRTRNMIQFNDLYTSLPGDN